MGTASATYSYYHDLSCSDMISLVCFNDSFVVCDKNKTLCSWAVSVKYFGHSSVKVTNVIFYVFTDHPILKLG